MSAFFQWLLAVARRNPVASFCLVLLVVLVGADWFLWKRWDRLAVDSERTRQEGEAMLAKVQPGERIVTLEVQGKAWSTEQLASELDRWRLDARTVNLMVGGPEGLAPEVCARSEQRWSLSPLTLPHPLVRILVGEQIYRAWTLLSGHPYHK